MKRVLVTGAAGFIGYNLTKELLKQSYEVCVLLEKENYKNHKKIVSLDSGIIIYDDLEYLIKNANSLDSFDYIFHLATVGVAPEFNDIQLLCDVNVKMACRLVDFAKKNHSGLLINVGSCFEYGDHGDVLLTEDMICKPESLYAISKNASTNLSMAYAKNQNVSMICVRPFGVFGDGEGINRLAPYIINSCLKREKINTTEGNQVRDFVNVKDVVKSMILLASSNYVNYEIYNICSSNPVKVKEFIMEIINVCQFDSSLIEFGALPYRKNEAMVFAGDNRKLQNIIQYEFPDSHKDGILDIYNSLKGGI